MPGVLHLARIADEKLKQTLGKPYHAVLGIGLVIEIVRRCHELAEAPRKGLSLIGTALTIAFGLALLINQLAELSHSAEEGKDRRRTRGASAG